MNRRKKILLAPLDWGIGHATRCVPLIDLIREKGADVVIASSGRASAFLRSEFPAVQHIQFPGYDIRYPASGSMAMNMFKRSPAILRSISDEHRTLDLLIDEQGIDAVISDNRFGMWSGKVPSVYITHQVMIKAPKGWSFTEGILYSLHRKYIKHYDECWIPDFEEDGGLSGDLAHKRSCPVPAYFIGPQSRFRSPEGPIPDKKYDLMAIISGPEPQRSIFEELILKQFSDSSYKSLVLLGKPESDDRRYSDNIEICNHMQTGEMQEAMGSTDLIICRPGYSGIMDIATLGCRTAFVPTPGQTEQEYLGLYHMNKNHFYMVPQQKLDIDMMIKASNNYAGLKADHKNEILNQRLDELLTRL